MSIKDTILKKKALVEDVYEVNIFYFKIIKNLYLVNSLNESLQQSLSMKNASLLDTQSLGKLSYQF